MIATAVETCPDDLWSTPQESDGPPFWKIAYHALFYVDFYLSDGPDAHDLPDFAHQYAQLFEGRVPFPPYEVELPGEIYTKQQLTDYIEHCRKWVHARVEALATTDLEAAGPFPWVPGGPIGTLLYNLRHAAHHAGQLNLLLRRAGHETTWHRGAEA